MSKTRADMTKGTQLPRFKAYPKYKDSGVEWLGEIPAQWNVQRADTFLSYDKVQMDPSKCTADLVFYYSIPAIQETGNGVIESPAEIDSSKLEIRTDCVLVSKLNPRKGVVIIAHPHDIPTICSTEFVPFETNGCDLHWAFYLFLAESTRQRISAAVRSATRSHQRAEISDITKIWHGVPTVAEQRSIATFLDRETARIDALVAKREKVIELLQEKRTALITRAVTKGLDPNVPMKDSGVEWLGEIPTHWAAKKMWRISTAISGGTPAKDERGYWDGDVPWVSPKDMKRRFIQSSADTITERALRETGIKLIAPPVVLIVVRGMILAHTFPVAITTVPVTINQDMKALQLAPDVASLFLAWYFDGLGKGILGAVVEEASHGTRVIRMDEWRSVVVALPPIEEQNAIVAYLDAEVARIDAIVAKIRASIGHLKEFRTAIISAAVTGKIDVRKEAA
ncbi:MAG: restriction endonuclease subunit S [Gemmatimonadaceae bacterium]